MKTAMRWQQSLSLPLSRAIMVLGLALGLTCVLSVARYQLESDKEASDFTQRANVRIAALTDRINASIDTLGAINQLFTVNQAKVSREQFRQFVQPYLAKYPYIQTFVFHRLVRHEERARFEADSRRIFPNFIITELQGRRLIPAGKRDIYVVDDYIEPLKGNEITLGYDTISDRLQAKAFWRATESGKPIATDLKSLLQTRQKGFTVMMPVYREGMPLTDPASRRAAVMGDTEVVFIAENLVREILENSELLDLPGIHINVYAADRIDESKLVFRHGSPPADRDFAASGWSVSLLHGAPRRIARTFDLAGTPWHIIVSSTPPPVNSVHFGSLLILLAGSILSFGAAARIYGIATQSRRVEELVHRRTVELRATAEALQLRHRAIEASPNAIVITGATPPDFAVEYVNPAFERMTGYAAAEILGGSLCDSLGIHPAPDVLVELKAALHTRQEAHATFQCRHKDGRMYWNDIYIAPVKDEKDEVHHYVCMQYDITETKRYEEELEFRANHDTLTGLANRNLLCDRLVQTISYASRYQHNVWVVFIDLDRFKFVNDSLGHQAGDELLQTMAMRLQSMTSDMDTVARLGGDEFILLLPASPERHGIPELIASLLDEVAKPVLVRDKEFFITCSIGIAIFPNDGIDPDVLVSHADIAMFRAKELGGNNFMFFETSMNESTQKRLQLEGDLRKALDQAEFELHYQPQVDLHTGKVVGVEALIRWRHPKLGLINPARFIDLAEETGLIVQIGKWALHTACMQNKTWQRLGLGNFSIAVNLSALEFAQPDIVETITGILAQSQLHPQFLELEMTESMIMRSVEATIPKLRKLKELGIRISVDDFGTGYSSLSYLTRFPIDVLKIDQSFVRHIPAQQNSAMLVTSIISIAHNLQLRVIAEGVETSEQLAFLYSNGCDEIQGFYCSKPLSADKLEQLLTQDKGLEIFTSKI